jgi:CheY-like chemotaxis protein
MTFEKNTTRTEPVVALVDDDKVFQLIASRTIKATQLTDKILQFTNGMEAIEYLQINAENADVLPDVLFLDINMPIVDGWMFMEDYINLKHRVKKIIRIYMVSSSIDQRDVERARSMTDIREYVIKPISQDKFAEMISNVA